MQRILLTGGAGFIGCNTALVLLEKGFDVIIFDSFINSSEESIYRLEKVIDLKKGLLKGGLKVIKGDFINKNIKVINNLRYFFEK